MPTVIPLIPGGSLYYAMDAALRHDAPEFILKAQKAIGLAVALAAGIIDRYVIEAADRGAGAHSS